jgi:hypothetical protein
MRIAFGRTRPGIRSLFHLCAEPDLVLEEPDLKSEPQFIHVWTRSKHLVFTNLILGS